MYIIHTSHTVSHAYIMYTNICEHVHVCVGETETLCIMKTYKIFPLSQAQQWITRPSVVLCSLKNTVPRKYHRNNRRQRRHWTQWHHGLLKAPLEDTMAPLGEKSTQPCPALLLLLFQ